MIDQLQAKLNGRRIEYAEVKAHQDSPVRPPRLEITLHLERRDGERRDTALEMDNCTIIENQ